MIEASVGSRVFKNRVKWATIEDLSQWLKELADPMVWGVVRHTSHHKGTLLDEADAYAYEIAKRQGRWSDEKSYTVCDAMLV